MDTNGRFALWPIVKDETGEWSVDDKTLAYVFYRMLEENKWTKVFSEGSVKDLPEWIDFIKNGRNIPVMVLDQKQGDLCLIAWLNNFAENRSAFGHFCSIGKYKRGSAEVILDYWRTFGLRIILGMTPEDNKQALRFIGLIGFKEVGKIPAMFRNGEMPGVLSYYQYE